MNQGVGGQWGAIKYSDYSVIMLAESADVKIGFFPIWNSAKDSLPVMSVQTGAGRVITGPTDLFTAAQHVRPVVTFQITGGDAVRVVFMHLKSGNEKAASAALATAVDMIVAKQTNHLEKVIWIGDFNRATTDHLANTFKNVQALIQAGGVAAWSLDCAYATGDWTGYTLSASVVSKSSDNDHAAIAISYTKTPSVNKTSV